MRRTATFAAAAAVLGLLAVVVVRTLLFVADAPPVEHRAAGTGARPGAVERLSAAVRLPTVTAEDPAAIDRSAFHAFREYLVSAFPRVHATLSREIVGESSVLYTWPGRQPSAEAVLVAAHLDVVPVEPGTQSQWTYPPFGGVVAEGFVWGRGTVDDKSGVLGTMEAVEALLARGFHPERTVYLAYGHDEEAGGEQGAARIAERLERRGVRLAMVLDEGGVIADGFFPGLTRPAALIGVAEKGAVTVRLTARATGGHASMPPPRSAVGAVAAALSRLEQQPMPARLAEPTRTLLQRLGVYFPFVRRAAIANLWITEPLVLRQLSAVPSTNAAVRSTMALTMVQAGVRPNVLPAEAKAVVNVRILPGDSIEAVLSHLRRVIDDPAIEMAVVGPAWEPSPISSTTSLLYRALAQAIHDVRPEVAVVPYLVVGATDARHYRAIAMDTYRWRPMRMTPADVERLHGTNERIAVTDFLQSIEAYERILEAVAGQRFSTVR